MCGSWAVRGARAAAAARRRRRVRRRHAERHAGCTCCARRRSRRSSPWLGSGVGSTRRTASSAHHGSYLGRVWVSPSTVLRCCSSTAAGCPYRPPTRPQQVKAAVAGVGRLPALSGVGLSTSASSLGPDERAGDPRLGLAQVIETMLCPEATDVQVQVLFTRARARGAFRRDPVADRRARRGRSSCSRSCSRCHDNGAQIRSGSTRRVHRPARDRDPLRPSRDAHRSGPHRVAVRPRQVRVAYLLRAPASGRSWRAARRRPRAVQRASRLHAGIGYVTPNDEHEGRGPTIRQAAVPAWSAPASSAWPTTAAPTRGWSDDHDHVPHSADGDRSPSQPRRRTAQSLHNAPGLDAAAGPRREWVASLARHRSRTGTTRSPPNPHPASDQQRKQAVSTRDDPRGALRPASPFIASL